ncbi:uncharacterized protein [Haliotis cracherodii]|uniref:uncharacterized protein n=1 Tax=Haliotis cracherodii TaxID=6455 RepID=UPI0039E86C58
MHNTQAGDMWTARLLVCYLHCVYATSVNISTETKHIFINEEENNWWDARENCKMERDLYISDTEFLPPVVNSSLQSNTSYWVGAMRYSTWIWTEDGTPLYNYEGYSASPTTSPNNVSSNSVYECQLQCKTNRTVGLSGVNCYCLGNSYNVTNTSARGMQCPGNPDEMCGDAAGMSVYTRGTGNVGFKPSKIGRCAYGVKMNNTVSIGLDFYYACIDYKRRFAYYSHNTQQEKCSGSVCVSPSAKSQKQIWTHAHYSNDLIRLNDSTAREIQNIPASSVYFWIGLVLKVSRKYVDGQETNGNEDYIFLRSEDPPTSTCQALKKDGVWKQYWLPCHLRLASVCEVSRTHPSHPTTDVPPAVDSQMGVIIGLAAGCVVFFLVVVTLVFLLQRQRKLYLDRKDTNQQVNLNPQTENTTYDGLDVPRDNGAYSVITPDTIDGKPFTPSVPTATVNPNTHTEKFYVNHPGTDVEKMSNSLSMPSKQHTDMPRGKPHMHLSGPDYDTAECILQYRSGDGGYTGLDISAVGTGVANSDEGVQYHTLEKRSSPGRDKSDAGLYDPTEAAEVNYDTSQQGGNARKVDDSYSHIGAIGKGFEEGAYDVASAGPVVIRLDDTYNHANETNHEATD